jgi:peptide-methionine (S)-S-oxide reductase
MRNILSFMLAGILIAFAVPSLSAEKQASSSESTKTAIFAGGCFWCVEQAFDGVDGVLETTSGYTGGTVPNPTYRQVSAGGTKHAEAVRVRYDPSKVTYAQLLVTFWHNIDPLDGGGQFCDRGDSYRSAIFVMGEAQKKAAEASKKAVEKELGKPVATEIVPAAPFYPAEAYHQDYYLHNPVRYKFYKWNCGRAQRLEQIWGPKEK